MLGIYQQTYLRRQDFISSVRIMAPGQILPKANWHTIAVARTHLADFDLLLRK
jgi:hypothetical protein